VQYIFGGDKNQARVRDRRHFERPDGAWFDFAITLSESKAGLELLAFDFEIRFSTDAAVPFIRFDLNLAGHANEAREMRCHVHPGSDEIQVPSPLMSPLEILELFIVQLRPTRVGRAPTGFEIDWHRAYLQRHAPVPAASPAVVPEDGAAPQDLGETDVPAGEGEVDGGVES